MARTRRKTELRSFEAVEMGAVRCVVCVMLVPGENCVLHSFMLFRV